METNTPNVLDKAMCLSITFHRLGDSKEVDSDAVTTLADKEFISTRKKLFKSESYDNICTHYRKITKYLKKKCSPFPILKSGVYLVSTAKVETIDNAVEQMMEQLPSLVDLFMLDFTAVKQEAAAKLGPLYHDSDYGTDAKVRASFSIVKQYLHFSTPENLKEIAPSVWQREDDKLKSMFAGATITMMNNLRAAFQEAVSNLLAQLTPGTDGSQKRFNKASLKNLKEFIADFPDLNITDDAQLAALVETANQLIDGVSPEFLRIDDNMKAGVVTGLEPLKDTLTSMLVDAPTTRKFKLLS